TTARYFTPNGRSIQAKGIEPDVVMDQGGKQQQAKGDSSPLLREANLPRHLEHPGGDKAKDTGANADVEETTDDDSDAATANVKEGELGKDPQLDRALELLKSGQVQRTTVAQRAE